MINEILLKLITFIHLVFILFVLITPFVGSNYFLLLHAIIVPFIILHWIVNDNTCCLTVCERFLRRKINGEKDDESCITCKLIEPIYDFKKNYQTFSNIIYGITLGLWFITLGRFACQYKTGHLTTWTDLMKV